LIGCELIGSVEGSVKRPVVEVQQRLQVVERHPKSLILLRSPGALRSSAM
jgi:hypothetical protein